MDIFPAIDLKNGQCVRLTQGDFGTAKTYESDPVLQAKKFADAGADWLHMVDLDGARDSEMRQFDIIAAVAKQARLRIQVGGGVRSEKTVEDLLGIGADRVVIGSLAVEDKILVRRWLKHFGAEHITLAFDVRINDGVPEVLTHGWQSGSKQLLWDILDAYADSGLQNILCTDVGRDGMLAGVNNTLYDDIRKNFPELKILASGGVSNLDDLLGLAKSGLAGAVVGKAIYENRIDLADAIIKVRNVG